jgi:hypothetical protein
MRLYDLSNWDELFRPLVGKRLGYVRGELGNVGDTLQELALYRLVQHYGLDCVWLGPVAGGREPWDWELADGRWDGTLTADVGELLLFGGGNMGIRGGSRRIREKASRLGLPITILPNSWRAIEDVPNCVRYSAREWGSLRFCPRADVFPDLALSLDFSELLPGAAPTERLGVFLRTDQEARFAGALPGINQGPPFGLVGKRDVTGYARLAERYETLVTDALHFAICGLAAGREVYLLPGQYHKNRSMFEAWLAAVGCRWAESPESLDWRSEP